MSLSSQEYSGHFLSPSVPPSLYFHRVNLTLDVKESLCACSLYQALKARINRAIFHFSKNYFYSMKWPLLRIPVWLEMMLTVRVPGTPLA